MTSWPARISPSTKSWKSLVLTSTYWAKGSVLRVEYKKQRRQPRLPRSSHSKEISCQNVFAILPVKISRGAFFQDTFLGTALNLLIHSFWSSGKLHFKNNTLHISSAFLNLEYCWVVDTLAEIYFKNSVIIEVLRELQAWSWDW